MNGSRLIETFKDAKLRFYLFRHGFRLGHTLRQQCLGQSPARSLLHGARSALFPERRILFRPMAPVSSHVLFKLCGLAGIGLTTDANKPHVLAWHFDSDAFAAGWPDGVVPPGAPVVNGRLRDVRKQNVEIVFERVFGYPLAIDPTTHEGPAICKSNRNGKHDGEVVQCPVPRNSVKADHAYQRLIDNSVGVDGFLDLRVPVHGGSRIPLVYKKVRPASARFTSYVSTEVVDADDVFTRDEQKLIFSFARDLGLDFGEMDILRDNRDGRIYIVDVNNTPYGPPHHLSKDAQAEVFRRQLASLEQLIGDCVQEARSGRGQITARVHAR